MFHMPLCVEISNLELSILIHVYPYLMLAWNPHTVSESPNANITIVHDIHQMMLVNHLVQCILRHHCKM